MCYFTRGWKINHSYLTVKATVPGISNEQFQSCAEEAKNNCPVSIALNMDKTLVAELL